MALAQVIAPAPLPLPPSPSPPPRSFTPFIAMAPPRTQQEAPRCLLRPKSFQVGQEINTNKLVCFSPHSLFSLPFLVPKAEHTDQVGSGGKCQVQNQTKLVFPSVSIRTVQFFPLTFGRNDRSSFSLRPMGVGTGTPIPLLPGKRSSARPIKHCRHTWGRGTSFIP